MITEMGVIISRKGAKTLRVCTGLEKVTWQSNGTDERLFFCGLLYADQRIR